MKTGNIKIADDVIKTIAAKATTDIEGVHKIYGGVADELSKILGNKKPTNGIKVEMTEKDCSLDIYIVVDFGYRIEEVCSEVYKSVMATISEITGLKVSDINIYVQDIYIGEPEKKSV